MFKFLIVPIVAMLLSGCSLIPRITFDRPGVTPQATQKSTKVIKCSGDLKYDAASGAITCSKGFVSTENNFKQEERKYTLQERIANMIRSLAGIWFWVLVLALIFVPGLGGWLIGRIFNVFRSALTGTVKAIGNFKSKIPTVIVDGHEVPDPKYMLAVDALLDELENEHSKDANVLRTITDIRLRLKIEDND